MRLKWIIASLAVALCSPLANAQEEQKKQDNPNPWFIQGGLGMSYTTGSTGIGKLLSPTGQIAVGKYFSPVWGARLAISGWQGRYGSANSRQSRSFYYGAATVDGLMNISQWLSPNEERTVDVSGILGVGFNRAFWGCSSLMGRIGAQAGIRLNNALDLNVEATFNGVSKHWNKRDDHKFIDSYTNLLVGVTYKFGVSVECPSCISVEYYNHQCINDEVNEMRVKEVVRVDTVTVEADCPPVETKHGLKAHVTFPISKTKVSGADEVNVLAIADYLKANPEAKATIAGYADKGTGTSQINHRLAKERAENVANLLVDKYGISRDRLTVVSMENHEQPFSTNDWNRVVIMTAE